MEATVLNPLFHEQAFGLLIVLYFFLAGLSAGCFLISAAGSTWQVLRPLTRPAAFVALVTFIPAPLLLIADLPSPEKFFLLLLNFNPTSVMAWGTWIVSLYGAAVGYYAWVLWQNKEPGQGQTYASILLALALAAYTGLLIGVVPARPLWNSAVVPILFVVSGLVCAVAFITLLTTCLPEKIKIQLTSAGEALKALKPSLVTAELLLIAFHLIVLALASVVARETVWHMLAGPRQVMFVGVQIVAGLILPLVLLVLPNKKGSLNTALAGLLSVIGVFALRLNFVFAGQEVALVPGSIPLLHIPGWQVALSVVVIAGVALASYYALLKSFKAGSSYSPPASQQMAPRV